MGVYNRQNKMSEFLLLKLYQYILIGVGVIFGYLFLKYLKNYGR